MKLMDCVPIKSELGQPISHKQTRSLPVNHQEGKLGSLISMLHLQTSQHG